MYVSAEIITTIVAVFGALATAFGGIHVMMQRLERRFEQQMDLRFGIVDSKFEQIDKRFEQIDKQLGEVRDEVARAHRRITEVSDNLVNLQITVARLEGPRRTLELPVRK